MTDNTNNSEKERIAKETEKRQISILQTGNTQAILKTIKEIRDGNRISILIEIFELMLYTKEEDIRKSCSTLLCDIKIKKAVPLLIAAIRDEKFLKIRNILVSACWQNGMDYHDDVLLFADILINDDYITALEAFTVIENSIGELDDPSIVQLMDTLNRGLDKTEEQKKVLIKELIATISAF